jgi:hypothetical protein
MRGGQYTPGNHAELERVTDPAAAPTVHLLFAHHIICTGMGSNFSFERVKYGISMY